MKMPRRFGGTGIPDWYARDPLLWWLWRFAAKLAQAPWWIQRPNTTPHGTHDGEQAAIPGLTIHQLTLIRLMVLLGISAVLAACSTVSGPPPVGDPPSDLHGSTDQKRDSDPGSSETETPQESRLILSRGTESRRGERVVEIARKHVGTPYRWGGTSPSGFDCSGLVRYVYAQVGVSLPHNAAKQYRYGTQVSRDRLEPGDLIFFDRLRHNGIYVGRGRFIHARQTGKRVSIERLDQDWYAERWVGARRL
jgi:cell wall-associated NlpC family hydrolase